MGGEGGGRIFTVIHIRCEPGFCADNNVRLVGINKAVKLELTQKSIPLSTTHLGILQSKTRENYINIEDILCLARRTLYALINTGVHGLNGLNLKVSFKICQCYIIPRLLFGLEVLPLTAAQLNILFKE